MTIPNLTCEEVGAVLQAVGETMANQGLSAEAVLDFDNCDDPEGVRLDLDHKIREAHWGTELSPERSEELTNLTLQQAIEFNPENKA